MCSRLLMFSAVMPVLLVGIAVAAQRPYPVYNEYHLDRTMKLVGRNFSGANTALTDRDFETAKAFFTRTREQIAVSITFWRHKNRIDAIGFLRDTIEKLDKLDTALSASKIEETTFILSKQVKSSCDACHVVYRQRDPDTGAYQLKPGSV